MSYKLVFHPKALKEWQKLDKVIKKQFKKKLSERLKSPKVAKDKLQGHHQVYKIKLKDAGYRLAYQVRDNEMTIFVIVIGKRENKQVYRLLENRKTVID